MPRDRLDVAFLSPPVAKRTRSGRPMVIRPPGGDEIRAQYAAVFAAVRVNTIQLEPDLVRYLVHWLGDLIRIKQQPGQPGVPEGLVAAQKALAEAHAAVSDSRRQEQNRGVAAEIVALPHDADVGTAEAAAELGISADAVRWHFRKGNLDGRRVGRQLMVSARSIENLKRRKAERSA